jgi:threonine aldolase
MRKREFRSDTMTRPTEAMRDAMRNAEVGDDVCEEDPTAIRLQTMAAEKVGTEAALFVPSGTFGNQCAIGVHTRPGDEVILSETVHVVEYEAGAAGALSGVQMRTVVPSRTPHLTAEDIAPRLRTKENVHFPHTGLIVLENALTSGSVMPLDAMAEVAELARKHGVPIHLDGARLFNAAISLGVAASEIARHCDSVTFCLSKGLAAPVGSLLCGTNEFIAKARRRRKIMGGGMRQVGVLCAAGIIALEEGPGWLVKDHENARLLADLLAEIPGIVIDLARVQINMVFLGVDAVGRSAAGLAEFLNARDFSVYPPDKFGLRLMLSREVDEADVRALADTLAEYMDQG